MVTINQLKEHYYNNLVSYRKLTSFHYKSASKRGGYVIGLAEASEITDNGFWNNENLFAQFDVKNQKSSGSQLFDGIIDVVKDTEVEKLIYKASEESTGKLVFYVPEGNNQIMADLIFFNKSKNRNMDEALIALDDIPAKFSQKTYSASSGNKSFEDVITFGIGDFSFFKERVLGKKCAIYFNSERDEDDEAKDFLGLIFEIKLPLVDVASVDYLVNGDQWEANYREKLIPAIERGLELSNEQTKLGGVEKTIIKAKKKAKTISWVTAVVLFFISTNIWGDNLEGGSTFLLLLGIIAIGMSGKYIGKKMNEKNEKELKDKQTSLSASKSKLESQIRDYYLIKE